MREKLPFAKIFAELHVYKRAYALSLVVHRASLGFPPMEQGRGIAEQMRRASKGVCANIAEGYGKSVFPAEWRRFLLMALGSCQEMQVWTQYAVDLEYLNREDGRFWWNEYTEISKMIQVLVQKTKMPLKKAAA